MGLLEFSNVSVGRGTGSPFELLGAPWIREVEFAATYITTLGYVMEAAAKMKIPVYVLDRPNPLGGILVEGPRLDASQTSFVGYYPLPVRHGMTVGELATRAVPIAGRSSL